METLLLIFTFLVATYICVALLKTFTKYGLYQRRLDQIKGMNAPIKKSDDPKKNLLEFIISLSRFIAPKKIADNIQSDLTKAGIPLKAAEYLVACFALILVLPILIYVLTYNVPLAFLTIIGGLLAPKFYVKRKKENRIQALNQQLGDGLIIMANALRAGFGFQQAMDAVRKEMPHPISTEFSWTLREMNLGFSQEEALLNLSKRAGSDDLDMVVTGIIIQRQIGGNLAEILENIAGTIRERDRVKREVKVLTAQGKMSGIVIGVLPIIMAAFILVISPDYFNGMVSNIVGVFMLVGAVLMEIIGILVIKGLVSFDY